MNRSGINIVVALGSALLCACGGAGGGGFDANTGDGNVSADTGPRWQALGPPSGLYQCGASVTAAVDTSVIDSHASMHGINIQVALADPGYVDPNWTHALHVGLLRGGTEVLALADQTNATPGSTVSAMWDGTLMGAAAPVDTYVVRATYGCSSNGTPAVSQIPVSVVRVGTVAATIGDGDGTHLPMLWHRLNHVAHNYWLPDNGRPVLVRGAGMGFADLDQSDGTPRPFPTLSTALDSPPVDATGEPVTSDYNLPFALSVVTHPDVVLTFGLATPAATAPGMDAGVADGGTASPGVRVRARMTEANVQPDVIVANAEFGTYRLTALPAPNVGRYDLTLHVAFEYDRGDGTWGAISTETVPITAYGLIGPQTISLQTTAPYAAWYAIVDAVAGWVGGSTADPDMVSGQIVHHVYDDLGLHYDVVHGASFYTDYRSGYGDAIFDLTSFLDLANGTTVNCSDCASIVSTYANMVGCDLGYNIIQHNFLLDYIHAIGTPAFTNDPFNTGHQGGFNYHAVTAPYGEALVFDATLHEDGDADPTTAPFTETVVDGLMQPFYLSHLSPSHVTVSYDDKTSIE